jgi:sugar transferase (PEP-CTERM system associated)
MTVFGLRLDRFSLFLGAIETVVLGVVFISTQWLVTRNALAWGEPRELVSAVFVPMAVLLVSILAFGAYQNRAIHSLRIFAERLAVGGLLAVGVIFLFDRLALGHGYPIAQIALAVSSGCGAIFVGRAIGWQLSPQPNGMRPRAIVLGSRSRAAALWSTCGDTISTHLHAFVNVGESDGLVEEGVPFDRVVPMPNDLAALARSRAASEIVVALDDRRGSLPTEALLDCRRHGVRVLDSVSFLEREMGKVDIDGVYPSWLIFSSGFERGALGSGIKRLMDVVLSLALLALLFPLLVAVALLIRLDSPGPVFYWQWRVGQNGRPFQICKFRSMRNDAENGSGACWAQVRDPRVTRIGRFLRRSRIDEIPQAINVLKGEMSLVGPRPERPEFVTELSQGIRFYHERHRVKPGLTGWAQVNYHYGGSTEDAKEKLKYDLFYLKNESLFLDIYILLQTARIVVFGEGAR